MFYQKSKTVIMELFKDKSEEKNIVIDELSKMKDAAVTIIEEYKSKIIT